MCELWRIESAYGNDGRTAPVDRDLRYFGKKHPHEFGLLMKYLTALEAGLCEGRGLDDFSKGKYKLEPMGICAIRLMGRSVKNLRLYVYPDFDRKLIILLCGGGKERGEQSRDINEAKKLLELYRRRKSEGCI